MHASRKLWTWLGIIFILSFAVLGWVGKEIHLSAPPIPHVVVSDSGAVLFSAGQVQLGQEAWLAAGGQQLGSVWGHGAYVAPDWSADWLRREALALRTTWAAREFGKPYEALDVGPRAAPDARPQQEMRRNTFVHSPLMTTLVWLPVPGDIVFSIGVACLALFALRLRRGVPRSTPLPAPVPATPLS